MDIKSYKLLLIFINFTSFYPLIVAVTKTVYFHKKSDCDAYSHYLKPGEIYEVVWNGEVYPKMCSIRFKMAGSDTYIVYAEVTVFDLECERPLDETRLLQFYCGVPMKQMDYDCHARLPINYCSKNILYMRLEPDWNDIRASVSEIRITVTSTFVSRYDDSSTTDSLSSGLDIKIVVMSLSVLMIIFCLVAIVIKKRAAARDLERNGGAVIIQRQGNNVFVATFNTGQPVQSMKDYHSPCPHDFHKIMKYFI